MTLFLDTSVLLAASESASGASREIFQRAGINHWTLIATPYVLEEVARNFPDLSPHAVVVWPTLKSQLSVRTDMLVVDRPVVFGPPKDKPILFSALAWADVLLTLDEGDFGGLMEKPFYGLLVMRPGTFLHRERASGKLK